MYLHKDATAFMMTVNKFGRRNKALIISVSNYNNRQPLDFCKNDGEAMSNILHNLGYEILDNNKLIGSVRWEAMSDAIIDFFSDPKIKPQDTLLFYYSGHGVPDIDGDVYLATSEIDPDVPNRRGFSFHELTKMIQRSISIRIIAILDCCYSGSAKLSKGNGDEDAAKLAVATIDNRSKMLKQGEGKCILAASQAYQEAYELVEQDHSIFTYYLLQGLKGDEGALNINGCVTADSLSTFVYDSMMSLPPGKRPKQKPIRKVEASGDIILAYYSQLAKRQTTNDRLNLSYKSHSSYEEPTVGKKKELEKNRYDNNQSIPSGIETDDDRVKKYVREHEESFSYLKCAMDLQLSISKVRGIISRLGLL
jgi:uncharacterized caspase-like protein